MYMARACYLFLVHGTQCLLPTCSSVNDSVTSVPRAVVVGGGATYVAKDLHLIHTVDTQTKKKYLRVSV